MYSYFLTFLWLVNICKFNLIVYNTRTFLCKNKNFTVKSMYNDHKSTINYDGQY